MIYIIIFLLAFATWKLPLPGKIILIIINSFLPDPLPWGDEIVQIIGIVKKTKKVAIKVL